MRVFVRSLSCFLILQSCLCAGVLVLYRRYAALTLHETGYLAASVDKHHLLVHQPSPRIVFVGGSNLAFGLDSGAIERSLGYHPVNMGLNLGLAACRRDNAMANYKALRLVRSRPFVPEKPQERIRENPGA